MSLVRGKWMTCIKEQYSELFIYLEDDETIYLYLGVTENARYTVFISPIIRLIGMFEMYPNPEMPRGI